MIQLAFTAFLGGLAGISVPIILHFIRKKPTEPVSFPSFMFLRKSVIVKQIRNNIRKWIVLILRCLALILLSLAFSWPYIPEFSKKSDSAVVFLWDNSLSMTAKPYSGGMRKKFMAMLSKTDSKNPALVGIVSDKTAWPPKFSSDPKTLIDFFEKNTPGYGISSFENAIRQADLKLRENPAKNKKIVLITDRQKHP
jgi:hypothetical protein